jgi:hypothetical protein
MLVIMDTVVQVLAEEMEQALVAFTQTLPPAVPAFTIMTDVPCPLAMVHPVGTVQVYDVAPGTAAAVYVSPVWFWQTFNVPLTDAGACMLVPIETARQLAVELIPQTFNALAQMLPPAVPEVTVIELEP